MTFPSCINCGEELGGRTHVELDERAPSDGDLSICAYCGHLRAFDGHGGLRDLTDAEIVSAAGHPGVLKAQAVAERFRRERKP